MLTRLQVPAGKAIALAAMPTAVLMGMGLTPQLAQATSRAEDRYKPGPCVSQPDEADKADAKDHKSTDEAGEDKSSKDKGSKDGDSGKGSDNTSQDKGTEDKSGDEGSKPSATPTPSATSPADSGSSGSKTDDQADDKTPEKSPSPSPSESKSKNPLDPLGLGDALKDIFTGGGDDKEETAEPSATPTPSSSATGSSDKTTDPSKDTAGKAGDSAKDTVEGAGKTAKDTVDKARDKADDAGDKAGETPSPGPSSSSSPKAGDRDKDGKEPFPCPTFDAEAYENAETEPTASLLPDDPWTLKSTLLTLHGLDYKGIVEVKTYSGQVKKVLKFTASGIDIKDLHQLTKGAGGTTTHVASREGETSTFSNGPITMYTEELSGNLLGIVPITFSPKSPPPLNLPEVFFTDVTVTQAGQFGGDLTIPGMHLYKTGE
ncbi:MULTISPECIES: hydrogenase expression protein HypF [unclassified Streptomyces]|uniref:hydrogenase expression protein HypF n=1 Tax=unclassified Streptomyces TaxID=2593676 RepID=UPI003369E578